MRMKDKVAVVTGSGSGIGRSIAQLFAKEGAKVVLAEKNKTTGSQTATDILGCGGTALFHRTDTSDVDSVRKMVAVAVQEYGNINVLVNNAAAFVFGKIENVTEADWGKVFGVNVIGYANCVRECLPSMKASGRAAIVNIASVSSFIAQPGFIPYNASKGAVSQLTRCLAMDLAPNGIRVNAICPGAIKTSGTDQHIKSAGLDPEQAMRDFGSDAMLNRMGNPIEVAYGALFLASDEASFVTGAHLVIDGGATID